MDKKTGQIVVLPAAAPLPPRDAKYQAYFESIIDSTDMNNMVAFVCACSEEHADSNNDDCGFEIDGNQHSECKWEGDGEARCTCVRRVLLWGSGEEHVPTYAGDPVGGSEEDDDC